MDARVRGTASGGNPAKKLLMMCLLADPPELFQNGIMNNLMHQYTIVNPCPMTKGEMGETYVVMAKMPNVAGSKK